jgi:hypothetical protein
MQEWQRHLWPSLDDADRIRPAAEKRVLEAYARFKKGLGPAFDPAIDLDRIALPVAEYVADIHRIKPFPHGLGGLECLVVHSSCKYAGCPPPLGAIGKDHWEDAVRYGAKKGFGKTKRLTPLVAILTETLEEATQNNFSTALGSIRGRSYVARRERRELTSIQMGKILNSGS